MRIERDVRLGERTVGRVQVQTQGLYYVVTCRCGLSGDTVWRLQVSCGDRQSDLGVLVPEGDAFCLTTRHPVKSIGEGKLLFSLKPSHESKGTKFAPIYPEEPFSYIQRIKDAFLEERNGQLGAVWKE